MPINTHILSLVGFCLLAKGKRGNMEKKVNICGNEYPIKSSALTIANYKNIFGMDKEFGEDYSTLCLKMNELSNLYKNKDYDKQTQTIKSYAYLGKINELATKIAYVMIKEADSTFMSYEDWASSLENMKNDFNWVKEVVGIASYVF